MFAFRLILILISLSNSFPQNAFASMQDFNRRGQINIEQSKIVYEQNYDASFQEVFDACLSYFIEGNAEIYLKDYKKGIILARCHIPSNWSMPSDNMGFYLASSGNNKLKLTLKLAGRVALGNRKAAPDDVFHAIEQGIEFLRTSTQEKDSYKPKEGYVPNATIAIKIAEAVLIPIYGEKIINEEKPFMTQLINNVWVVQGTLHCPTGEVCNGGVAEIEISKDTGEVLKVIHGK